MATSKDNLHLTRWRFTTILVILAACAASVTVFAVLSAQMRQTALARLEAHADESMLQVGRRYETAVTMLRSMRGLFYASDGVTLDEFDLFFRTSGFREMFPQFGVVAYVPRVPQAQKAAFEAHARGAVQDGGTGNAGFAITPPGNRDEYWPILYSVPTLANYAGQGLDMLTAPVLRSAIERARDVGDVVISDDFALAVDGSLGAALVVPMYSTRDVPETAEERVKAFMGALGVTFSYADFPLGALSATWLKDYRISVFAGPRDQEMTFFESAGQASRLAPLYGELEVVRQLRLNAQDAVDLRFRGAAADLLAPQERLYPFGIASTTFLTMLASLLVILLMRRNHALANLQQRYEFVSAISHQLRTPLSKMRWSVDALLESGANKDAETTSMVRADVLILTSIVNDLLCFLEWGGMQTIGETAEKITVSNIIGAALQKIGDPVMAARVRTELAGARAATVLSERERLSTALWFLIDNALTYSRQDSPVTIAAAVDGREVVIRIIDQGYGIPKDEQRKVWSAFFRASNASLGKNAGSGVGIPLCAIVVKAHGGAVDFTSEEGKGTTFVVRLPMQHA